MKLYRHFIIGFGIALLMGAMSFSAWAGSVDADYAPYHQTLFSTGDVLLPAKVTPERISTAVMARSIVLGKTKTVDSINDKVVQASYKDRPGWFKVALN